MAVADVFRQLDLAVLERGWLSSNNIVFLASAGGEATVVDTGYHSHSEQTVALVRARIGPVPLARVLNTHLHSDHCGGNAALQAAWGCDVWVPEVSYDAVSSWDQDRLTYRLTDQACTRFTAQRPLAIGETVRLGAGAWQVIGASGHDPEAVMLFQPESRVLITADALWEDRLAIIFPELAGEPGFPAARHSLDIIASLEPRIVIPGHGRPFEDVRRALHCSRRRIEQFEADPRRHLDYAARALAMFHMLEHRRRQRDDLVHWLVQTPVFRTVDQRLAGSDEDPAARAAALVQRLVESGLLRIDETQQVVVPGIGG